MHRTKSTPEGKEGAVCCHETRRTSKRLAASASAFQLLFAQPLFVTSCYNSAADAQLLEQGVMQRAVTLPSSRLDLKQFGSRLALEGPATDQLDRGFPWSQSKC
jgi:hypothetical protein